MSHRIENERWNAALLRAFDRFGVAIVADQHGRYRAQAPFGTGVNNGLHVRSAIRCEKPEFHFLVQRLNDGGHLPSLHSVALCATNPHEKNLAENSQPLLTTLIGAAAL